MYDFNKKNNNKIILWIVVGILVACMVLPMAFQLIAAIVG